MGQNCSSLEIFFKVFKAALFYSTLSGVAAVVFLGSSQILYAKEITTKTGIALRGEPCRIAPHPTWTKQEKWVWKQVCESKPADFNMAEGYLDHQEPERRSSNRQLRSEFLESILLLEPYRSAIPRSGIVIRGAWFAEPFDLSDSKIEHVLWLDESIFEQSVNLTRCQSTSMLALTSSLFEGQVEMSSLKFADSLFMGDNTFKGTVNVTGSEIRYSTIDGSTFYDKLQMSELQVEDSLGMSDATFVKDVSLINAKIGRLVMVGSKVGGELKMNDLQVRSSVFMRASTFAANVALNNSHIGGSLEMSGSTFDGQLNLNSVKVDGSVFMDKKATFKQDVNLLTAKIGSQLNMMDSHFDGELLMNSLTIGQSLLLDRASIRNDKGIDLRYASIVGSLRITGSTLSKLDLTGAVIGEELRFDRGPIWQGKSLMILRNATIGALQDNEKGWPYYLELDGFVYKELGSIVDGHSDSMAGRKETELIQWLEKQRSYSPLPYIQLAAVLRESGFADKADAILYAGNERARARALADARWGDAGWLFSKNVFIGYGYKINYAIYWSLLLVVVGALIFKSSKEAKENKMPYGIAYSFDMLLPIIKLREKHYQMELSGWRRYYFFLHKIMGYVLASFLIAGLSGLVR